MKSIFWFRNDLRIQDHESLEHAIRTSTELTPVFLLPQNYQELAPIRKNSLIASLKSLQQDLPVEIAVLSAARELLESALTVGATRVVATKAFDTTGMQLQSEVGLLLYEKGIALELVGSNYAIAPGTIQKDDGTGVKVYTPFYNRWIAFGWPQPMKVDLNQTSWTRLHQAQSIPQLVPDSPIEINAGEEFAKKTFERFKARALENYSDDRNRMDRSGTSHLSHALAHGEIHPRTLLAQLGDSPGEMVFRKELAWREFYADVLYRNPHTLTDYYEPSYADMEYADHQQDAAALEAWKHGKTGYPVVDAAMRQLLTTGWMHNRARMIVASFLIKDLHFEWQVGAEWFERNLTDFDPASNSHGWQWTAGCGTDASPYYRVFNPILQGQKFDPKGDYVRKFVPELRHILDSSIHEPWKLIDGLVNGYPAPIVDHSVERDESLARLKRLKGK